MWESVVDGVQDGIDRISKSLNEYGPPIDLPQAPLNWLHEVSQRSKAALGVPEPVVTPPRSMTQVINDYTMRHRITGAYILGGALAVGIGMTWYKLQPAQQTHGHQVDGRRTQAIVLLDGDSSLGRALVKYLASRNLIVLVSTENEHTKHALEHDIPVSSRGYVKAICLRPGAEDKFVRAIHAALCMRYPVTSGGDPYARPGENVELLGVINAMSFATQTQAAFSLEDREFGIKKHVTCPLRTIHRLIPLLQSTPNRVRRQNDSVLIATLISQPKTQGVFSELARSVEAGTALLRRNHLSENSDSAARILRWTLVDVDASESGAFTPVQASTQIARYGEKPRESVPLRILEEVAFLVFARSRPVWPHHVIAKRNLLQWLMQTISVWLEPFVPNRLLDIFVATQWRFQAQTSYKNLDEHLAEIIQDATKSDH
ncbi:hypothetical protein MYAM1_003809 [Malassezia yamatoensis]|uniref:Uncharacterized protein n=1 Tax=Malassezia yamatoensis TaxID=253288 RepID=A0AAJ5YXG6_9BASI|nr:hypothetical protein MYAM1_003809 [Malassezia yamatoensis]